MTHEYQNGNYKVSIDDTDGTKIRDSGEEPVFIADFPESIDLNITDACGVGCPFCYRNCTPAGKHASYEDVRAVVETMMPWTEVALGGGSPIEHPDLDRILDLCSDNELLANITVHWTHFLKYHDRLMKMISDKKLFGIGVSIDHYDTEIVEKMTDNTVLHLIAGIIPPKAVVQYATSGAKILLLGYKNMGRAKKDEIPDMSTLKEVVRHIVTGKLPCKVLSFDNLALNQLGVKDMMEPQAWLSMYMGDDGVDGTMTSASMYVDAVAHAYARNSLTDVLTFYDPTKPVSVTAMYRSLR